MTERAAAGDVVVRVLGRIGVERDGAAVAVGGPRQRAVLARLVLAEGHLVPVERLIDDVWGDDAPPAVVGTLQGYISLLRRALGPDVLRRQGPGYVLDVPAEQVDATSFERLALEGGGRRAADPAGALEVLDAALALWRGPAYADVADAEWAAAAAVRLDELRLTALEARFDALLDLGQHGQAVAELERSVDEHPLHERFAAQLLLALYRSGRQADALRAYERTRRRLLEDLGLRPSPDLAKLEAAILAHEPWLNAPVPVADGATLIAAPEPAPAGLSTPPSQRPSPAPAASPLRLPDGALRHADRPFVGRAEELGALDAAWAEALAGRRRMAVLTGDPGSGKTRLASRFATEAHASGALVLWGRATTEAIVPYEPIVEALRTVLRTVSPEAQRRVVEGRPALSLLLPDLGDLVPGTRTARIDRVAERYVLFETVAELLDAESTAWPVVFVLDDLHCADQLSLRLLDHVLRHERSARLLVLGTVRTRPDPVPPALSELLGGLHRDGLLVRVPVGGLGPDEVGELLGQGAWAGTATGSSADAVHAATGGNPFFVTELAEHGGGASPDTLPASVREALGTRLDRLGEPTARVVNAAAVAGLVTPLPVLAAMGVGAGDALLDAVDEALAAGVLSEDGPSGSLTFPHALVRQAVIERLSRSRRAALHLAAADAMEGTEVGSPPELAQHLLEAGALAPLERRVQSAVAAGCAALAVAAHEEGERWAARALGALDGAGGGGAGPAVRCEALLLCSDAQRALGQRREARQAAAEAASAARASGDATLLARSAEALALARSGLGFDFGTVEEGLDGLLEEALRAIPDADTDTRLRLLGAQVSAAAAEGQLGLDDRSAEVLLLAEAAGHSALVATVHLSRRMASWKLDLLDARLAMVRAALAAAERAGRRDLELNALLYGIVDIFEAGDVEESSAWLARLRAGAAQLRQPVYDAFVLAFDATEALLRGEYESATKLADEALAVGRQSHGTNAEQAWFGQVFVRSWDTGDLAGLADLIGSAVEPDARVPIWRIAHGLCLVAAGRAEEARPALEAIVTDDGVDLHDNTLWMGAMALLTELARSLGDSRRAAILHRELVPYAGRLIVTGLGRVSLGPVSRVAGVAAMVAGDLAAADPLLAQSEAQCRHMGAVPVLARTLADRAELFERRGGPGDAEAAEAARARSRKLWDRVLPRPAS